MKKIFAGVLFGSVLLTGCTTTNENIPMQPKPDLQRAAQINADLAITYASRDMLDRAKEKLIRAHELDPSIPSVYYAEGFYYQQLGMPKQAERAYQRALSMAPNDPQAVNFYAQFSCHYPQGYARANQLFQRSITLPRNTSLGETFTLYGDCLNRQGNIAEAKEMYERALRLGGNFPAANLALAQIEFNEKNYPRAEQYINAFIRQVGFTRENLTLKLDILQAQGKVSEAAQVRLKLNSLDIN